MWRLAFWARAKGLNRRVFHWTRYFPLAALLGVGVQQLR